MALSKFRGNAAHALWHRERTVPLVTPVDLGNVGVRNAFPSREA